jgi:hypothetical protein
MLLNSHIQTPFDYSHNLSGSLTFRCSFHAFMEIYSLDPHTYTSTLYLGLKTIMFMVAPFYEHWFFHVKTKTWDKISFTTNFGAKSKIWSPIIFPFIVIAPYYKFHPQFSSNWSF